MHPPLTLYCNDAMSTADAAIDEAVGGAAATERPRERRPREHAADPAPTAGEIACALRAPVTKVEGVALTVVRSGT